MPFLLTRKCDKTEINTEAYAGVDQFGGEACPEVIIWLVQTGKLSEERIDQSVRRLLRDKFSLGLFDHPYLDVEAAERIVGQPEFRKVGELAQRILPFCA
ncbi:MAG TPA: hypothetical protein VK249_09140 [Anaerolineales bacterium]|nr:hypothetical protein [Anaerolineales bacterium]